MNNAMQTLSNELVAQGKSKREVMALIVKNLREAIPGITDAQVSAMGWEFYKDLCVAGR